MTDRKNQLIVPRGGMLRDVVLRLKLIGKLIGDKRVNFFLKLLPLASVVYLVWPMDVAPAIALPIIGVLDDAAILWMGTTLFVELCPPEVVREHMQSLRSNLDEGNDVIDAESTDV